MKTENHYTETDLGNISLNPRGEYDPEAFYEYLDTVSMDGGSYMCLAELGTKITGTPPVPGINTEHWQILTLPGGRARQTGYRRPDSQYRCQITGGTERDRQHQTECQFRC